MLKQVQVILDKINQVIPKYTKEVEKESLGEMVGQKQFIFTPIICSNYILLYILVKN